MASCFLSENLDFNHHNDDKKKKKKKSLDPKIYLSPLCFLLKTL